ncbi:hypothetical protein DTO021D3_4531 [Paecilomyces variotii]|nr:hypothetical protein DTO032I3_3650 [Paecilomyces variotii]KAJ9278622.1 hypothetical protein DTO021D3_4531 [Paecilomyces variotii]KAJ9344596.1 hypothetical protein DTO027B6_2778 [Paecilomyces variotii]KAJ9352860.1 hypothetical protein DTO027B9_5608 [Paecilomyces variotii]KAJ9380118.1 hypothetical protein DTO032I4_6808 [Paecilomyces variotii]
MAMQYFNQLRGKTRSSRAKQPDPVLTEEDEAFLQRVTSQTDAAPLPDDVATQESNNQPVGKDAQIALMDGAQNIPLPLSPAEEVGRELAADENNKSEEGVKGMGEEPSESAEKAKKNTRWSWMRKLAKDSKQEKQTAAADVSEVAAGLDRPGLDVNATGTVSDGEAQRETEDMTDVLERLNLAAVNNRVFSISDETQELLRKFKLIFKDLINGVPTAYHDLESLLTNGNKQLQQTYSQLPSFLQKLIERLPDKWTETLAPEILAAAAERAGKSGINVENAGKAAAAARKMGVKVPSLKELVGKPAAIVGMLRSIMAFLRARFPAVLGMNVLWSLALFILLFVLWYCHKRGREVRLENERIVTEEEIQRMNEQSSDDRIRSTETLTTMAPQGAELEEVRRGVQQAREARAAALAVAEEKEKENNNSNNHDNETSLQSASSSSSSPPATASTSSQFRLFSRKQSTRSSVQPYAGT